VLKSKSYLTDVTAAVNCVVDILLWQLGGKKKPTKQVEREGKHSPSPGDW